MPSVDPDTWLAQAGHAVDPVTGGVVPQIETSVTFARNEDHELIGGYLYSRYGTPTWEHAERVLAGLDGGERAMLFASGLAAAAAIIETVPPGGRLVAPTVMYHGVQDWMRRAAGRRGFELGLFEAGEAGSLEAAVRSGAAMVWIETPVNPTWDVIDIAAAASLAHDAGAILVVDSTVAPPVTQRPLEHGADLVFHSATKYLNGHGDVLGGAIVTRTVDDRWREIGDVRRLSGGVAGPFEAWLLLRGMRTLHLRFARQSENALRIARHLERHPAISAVLYPGLPSHPGHRVAARQMTNGFGGMLSIRMAGGRDHAEALVRDVRLWLRATSLGGVESLIEHRAAVEGPHSVVPDDLVRLSVGVEASGDLIEDLDQALSRETHRHPGASPVR